MEARNDEVTPTKRRADAAQVHTKTVCKVRTNGTDNSKPPYKSAQTFFLTRCVKLCCDSRLLRVD
jgi:hypothetical protein